MDPYNFSPAEDAFLEDLEYRSFRYFTESADTESGLISDRAKADGSAPGEIYSIAATGFGLAALAIGSMRGWMPTDQAVTRAERALRTCLKKMEQEYGFLYHYVGKDLKRAWECEISTIDTALLLMGALTVRQAFPTSDVAELAHKLYERVDWPAYATENHLIRHGFKPKGGFLPHNWGSYSELMGMVLLAVGAPRHPLPPAAWAAWERKPHVEYAGRQFLHHPPLFVHQFSHAFINFKGLKDPVGGFDYWENSVNATLAQRQFCLDLQPRFPGFTEDCWGLTSSDSRAGYVDWGGPPLPGLPPDPRIDGSVVPCAVAGSLPFAPAECISTLMAMVRHFGDELYGRYGFVDAFHPIDRWFNPDVIGIDVGITLLMAENARTGMVWNWFTANPEVQRALEVTGLRPASGHAVA